MDTWTRRKFLTTSGVAGGVALAAGATAWGVDELLATGSGEPDADASVLVLVTLYGGNDGLNTLVPASDPQYQDLRGDLAYAEEEVLPLGEGLGLNPGLGGLKKLWDERRLAVVRGVSYPRPDHSHFRSMAIWQTASPSGPVPSGWLGRWLDHAGDGDPLKGVSVGATLPPLMAGETTAGAAVRLGGRKLPDAWLRRCTALSDVERDAHPLLRRAGASLSDLVKVSSSLGGGGEEPQTQDPGEPRDEEDGNEGASAGGQGGLGAQLDVVARAIEAGVSTRAYSVSLGGFDTHANEKATQSRLLGGLDKDLTRFLERVRRTKAGRKVVVAVYSEFGRRPRANASQGTDHGTSGPVFVLGEPVKGGFYGDQPSLTDLTDDDLRTTVDFRDVYATLLRGVLDTEPDRILDGHAGSLAFL
ncbi:DUF1501 domain-containing protein [Streptomyces sp. MBT67]|uniref:DUF1501 domain-containing protein n=1 Tax=unclassified Streptomyces TaxID=2593676 RepID=UPI00190A966D|nr:MULTISPECIES: DUF1501 domain-containing protein [unclassified Streptomyces]MBK3531318.1 DUF1501 domain-containing protein [Streptomyces sp. MBT72]MBK3535762.1 DUF1501 domain-containing protein [Streptomyces sp. MBT67]MBK3549137.1 DUF1501 domain-containing protein [Streptomyces sp. MBT61]MBK6029205.1 DUF1501 domain-containing protein [Streptomyces sp. MBT59]